MVPDVVSGDASTLLLLRLAAMLSHMGVDVDRLAYRVYRPTTYG
jgi:hypothetical protein